jgi:hypothetical protein
VIAGILAIAGCAAPVGPASLEVDSGRYAEAFDAAAASASAIGLEPSLRDRRAGLIETAPRIAGSILEPWVPGNATLGAAFENTIAFQRRRVRFEFDPHRPDTPVPATPSATGSAPRGPDLFGVGPRSPDLTQYGGQLVLRVRVYVERAVAPGLRRDTWSRALTTQATIRYEGEPALPAVFWEPIGRDEALERRLLADVGRRLRDSAETGHPRPSRAEAGGG